MDGIMYRFWRSVGFQSCRRYCPLLCFTAALRAVSTAPYRAIVTGWECQQSVAKTLISDLNCTYAIAFDTTTLTAADREETRHEGGGKYQARLARAGDHQLAVHAAAVREQVRAGAQ